MKTLATAIFTASLVAGCATPAQQQLQTGAATVQLATASSAACVTKLPASADYRDLSQHLALAGPASLGQLVDRTTPSLGQVAALLSWHKGVQACRQPLLDAAQVSFPFMVEPFQKNYASYDAVYLALSQGQISFGAANRQLAEAKLEAAARNKQANTAWNGELRQEDRAEQAERAATFRTAVFSLQQTGAMVEQQVQQREFINAINRPPPAYCNATGASPNCATR